jgi:hypothetical protein
MRFWRKYGTLLLALLASGIAFASMGCMAVHPQYTSTIVLPIDVEYAGVTTCDEAGNPVVVLNALHISKPFMRYTRVHEYVHVKQMRTHPGGCWAFLKQYREDPAFQLQSEAEAMCGEINMAAAEGEDVAYAYQNAINHLTTKFGVTEVKLPCKPRGRNDREARQTDPGGLQKFR